MGRVLPILFNGDMVRAILDGKKTVTRRVIRFPVNSFTGRLPAADDVRVNPDTLWSKEVVFSERNVTFDVRPPYGIGDILYVRETWAFVPCIECMQDYGGKCSCNKQPVIHEDKYSSSEGCYVYREDCTEKGKGRLAWSPSIHMPKEAARIWLKVKNVKAERLQEIDGRGILAEGIDNGRSNPGMGKRWENMQGMAFSELWDSTIKKTDIDRYGWDANPWVWVIKLERCGKPEPCILNGIEPASGNRPCIGYQKSKEDDEPCGMCKGCGRCDGEEPESEGL